MISGFTESLFVIAERPIHIAEFPFPGFVSLSAFGLSESCFRKGGAKKCLCREILGEQELFLN